jgi:hypothetical protein
VVWETTRHTLVQATLETWSAIHLFHLLAKDVNDLAMKWRKKIWMKNNFACTSYYYMNIDEAHTYKDIWPLWPLWVKDNNRDKFLFSLCLSSTSMVVTSPKGYAGSMSHAPYIWVFLILSMGVFVECKFWIHNGNGCFYLTCCIWTQYCNYLLPPSQIT